MRLSELKLNPDNPRMIKDDKFDKLLKSLKEDPWLLEGQPIIIDKDNIILAGNMRYKALTELGYDEIPNKWIKQYKKLSKKQRRKIIIKTNISYGENDWSMLNSWDTKELEDWGMDLPDNLVNTDLIEDDFDSEKEYKKIEKPKSQQGELYKLGEHLLYCGSSTEVASYERLMGGGIAQMVFTDPPYNVDYKSQAGNSYSGGKYGGDGKIFNDKKTDNDFTQFIADFLTNCFAFTDDQALVYMWYASKNTKLFRDGLEKAGWRYQQDVIWVKEKFVFGFGVNFHRAYEPCMIGIKDGKYRKNKEFSNLSDIWEVGRDELVDQMDVWYFNRDKTNEYVHPTQKPVALSQRAFKRNLKQGDIVLDCFGGSGSTLIGCEQAKLKCRMIELDPKYVDVIRKRYAKFIGKEEEWETITPKIA